MAWFKALFAEYAQKMESASKGDAVEVILQILEEYLMIGLFNTEQELIYIIDYVLRAYNSQVAKLQGKLLKEGMNNAKLKSTLSACEAAMAILETIVIMYVQPIGKLEGNAMIAIKPFIELILRQMASSPSAKIAECSTKFDTSLIAVICRLLVIDAQAMLHLVYSASVDLSHFLSGWTSRMDYIVTHYTRRLNLLAVLSILPLLSVELLRTYMGTLLEYVVPLVESHVCSKETDGAKRSSSCTLTPTKLMAKEREIPRSAKWQGSERKTDLLKDDTVANIEIDLYFYMKYEQLMKATNLTHAQIKELISKEEALVFSLDALISRVQRS